MKRRLVILTVFALVALSSCSRNTGGGQHGTVLMRDGTSITGTVVSASGSEIQLTGDDKVTRTIPMAQVRSIEYDDTTPATAAGNTPPSAGAPPPASAPPPTSAPARPRESPHREHYHPAESGFKTNTIQ